MEQRVKETPVQLNRVMELSGYSRSYLYKLIARGQIPCSQPGGKGGKHQFFESEIIDFLTSKKRAANNELSEEAESILGKN